MIRIPIPPDLPLKEFLRLRAHADWYLYEGIRASRAKRASQPADRGERPAIGHASRRMKAFTVIAATQVT